MGRRTPAQAYALIFGIVLVIVGILGFFVEPSFSVGDDVVKKEELIVFEINGWHNVVHLVTGAIGIAVAKSVLASRTYCLAYGGFYLLILVLGLVALDDRDVLLKLIPINGADNVLHGLLALTAVGAGLATPAHPAPTTRARAA